MSPALAGGFLTPGPPGKSLDVLFYVHYIEYYLLMLHNNSSDCSPLCLMSFLLVLLLSRSHFITNIEYLVCTVLST